MDTEKLILDRVDPIWTIKHHGTLNNKYYVYLLKITDDDYFIFRLITNKFYKNGQRWQEIVLTKDFIQDNTEDEIIKYLECEMDLILEYLLSTGEI
jgi:hypothetical protein